MDDPDAKIYVWKRFVRRIMLQVEHLGYKVKNKTILRDINMEVRDHEFVGIIGPNGSGKSTLLKNIYKVLTPTEGSIRIDSENLLAMPNRRMASKLAVVAQENGANFDFTVEEVVQMGRYSKKKILEASSEEDRDVVRRMLEKTGMEAFRERSFLSLSGGEKQRVLIARAFAQETDMIVLDEPTNHLDAGSQMNTLKLLKESGKTVLTALHDLSLANRFCDRIYVLCEGQVYREGVPEDIISEEMIEKLYGIKSEIFHHAGRMYIDYL